MNPGLIDFRRYFSHLLRNLLRAPDEQVRSQRNHMMWTLGMLFVFPPFLLFTWTMFFLDENFRPGLRKQRIRGPLFIVGNFRSGSTFLQRLLESDENCFTTPQTWELVFAPAFSSRQFLRGIAIVDRWLGASLRRLLEKAEAAFFDEASAHPMGLFKGEEDEMFFIHIYSSAFLFFINPYLEYARRIFDFDRMESPLRRRRAMKFYESCIRHQLYAHGSGLVYLSKSPNFSARALSLMKTFPDARFIYLVRDPLEVIPSLSRWFSQVWESLEKKGVDFPHRDFLEDFVQRWYRDYGPSGGYSMALSSGRLRIVGYRQLVCDPVATLGGLYDWLGLQMGQYMRALLEQEQLKAVRKWKPGTHSLERYGYTEELIARKYSAVYELFEEYLETASANLTKTAIAANFSSH